jgi:O-antigen/teichoic acid export membrane protein
VLLIPRFGIEAAALVSSAGYIANMLYLLMVFKKEQPAVAYHFFITKKTDVARLTGMLSAKNSTRA